MADLGNLWFSLGVKDNTQKEVDAAIKRIEKLEAKMKLGIDKTALRTAITTYLKTQQFKAKITPELPKSAGKVMLEANKVSIRKSINEALKDTFTAKVKVVVEKASVQEAVKAAFAQAGLRYNTTASDVRAQRILEIQARMAQRAAINQEQLAAAHSRAQRAAALQSATTERLNRGMSNSWKLSGQLADQIKNLYSIYALERFGNALVQIGGEFQKQRIALTAMLGDSGKAQKIFDQIRGLAVESPYTFKDLAGFTKQMAAYSIPYEELYETTKRLADISSGLGVDMGRIILAYGQVRSAAFLRGTEVRQFTEAGIPLLDALAKKFTELEGRVVSVGDVFDKISRKEVPFEMVRDVLWEMTDAGGQFYNMQAVLTESLSGKYDKLKDSLQIMIGDMAEASSGVIGGTLDMLTALTDKWKEIGAVIVTVSTAVGTYKAAQAAANMVTQQTALTLKLAAASNEVLTASQARGIAVSKLYYGTLQRLNLVLKAVFLNPWTWAAAAVAGLAYVIYELATATTAAESAQAAFNKTLEDTKSKVDSWKNDVGELVRTIQGADNTDLQKQLAFDELKRVAPELTETYSTIKDIENADLSSITQNINALGDKRNVDILREQKEILQEYIRMASDRTMWGSYQLKGLTKTLQDDFGIEGDFGWSYDTYANAAQQALNKITGELYKLADAKERASVPTTIDVKMAETDYRDALDKFTTLSDFAAAMKREAKGSISPSVDGSEAKAGTDELIREIEGRLAAMEGIPLSVEQQQAKTELEEMLDYMRRWKEMGTVQGVFTIPLFFQARLDSAENALKEAKKQFNYITGRYEEANKSLGTLGENRSKAYKEWKEAERKYEEATKASMLYDKEGNAIYGKEEQKKELKRLKNNEKERKKAYEALSGKTKEEKKDPVAEMWKERIELIENALDSYKEWTDIEGKDDAATRVKDNPLYAPVRSYLETGMDEPEKIWEEIRKKLGKSKGQRDLYLELGLKIEDIERGRAKKELDKMLSKAKEQIGESLGKWDLYKEILDTTGDRDFAYTFSFGMDEAFKKNLPDYIETVKRSFDEAMKGQGLSYTFEEISTKGFEGVPEEVKDIFEEAKKHIEEYEESQREMLAQMVEDYRTTSDEIMAIEHERAEKLAALGKAVREGRISASAGETMGKRVNAQADWDKFRLSSDYLKYFSSIYSLTMEQAVEIGNAIRKNLDERLQAGTVSAEEYCEEIERIEEQLEKLRGKKSDFGAFFQGGLEGMFSNRYETAKSDYSSASIDYTNAAQAYESAMKAGTLSAADAAKANMSSAKGMMAGAESAMAGAQGAMSAVGVIDMIVNGINDTVQGIKGAFEEIKSTAEALGVDTGANTRWGTASAFFDTFGEASQNAADGWNSLKEGNIGGAIKGTVGSITSIIRGVAKFHDQKLDEQIEESKKRVEELEFAYEMLGNAVERSFGVGEDAAERAMASYSGLKEMVEGAGSELSTAFSVPFNLLEDGWEGAYDAIRERFRRFHFGLASKLGVSILELQIEAQGEDPSVYTAQYAALVAQQAEIQRQLSIEESKKDPDSGAIADYQSQLADLNNQIAYFVEDTASALYGIDLKDWASQIGDSLMEAFRNGEDAAEAFDKTVGEIMSDVVSNIIKIGIIEPAMKKISDALFGETDENGNRTGGLINTANLDDPESMTKAAETIYEFLNGEINPLLETSQALYDELNELWGGQLDMDSEKGGLRANIEGVTEDTAGLLASYINAIRADVSVERSIIESIGNDFLPEISGVASSQLQQLKQISDNTARNAELSAEIRDLLRSAKSGKGTGFYIR